MACGDDTAFSVDFCEDIVEFEPANAFVMKATEVGVAKEDELPTLGKLTFEFNALRLTAPALCIIDWLFPVISELPDWRIAKVSCKKSLESSSSTISIGSENLICGIGVESVTVVEAKFAIVVADDDDVFELTNTLGPISRAESNLGLTIAPKLGLPELWC